MRISAHGNLGSAGRMDHRIDISEIRLRLEHHRRPQAVYGPPTKATPPLFSADGTTLLTEKTKIPQRGAKHCRVVLDCLSTIFETAIARLPQVETNANLYLPPSLHETTRAMRQFYSRKAPGSDADAIPAEINKHGDTQLMDHLMALFQGTVSETFAVTNGVKQDCVLAPAVFRLTSPATLMDAYCDERPGICVAYRTEGHLLNQRRMHFQSHVSTSTVHELLYVIGCALNATTEGTIRRSMDLFSAACDNFGLVINTEKTGIMHQRHPTQATMRRKPA
nr:unnamed protein product [Spirometra erinaceieuropaei]